MGFRSVGFPPACHPATGFPILTPAGLTPAGHISLFWTHNRSGDFRSQAARQLTNSHSGQAFVHRAPFPFELFARLSPFAMWPAFPTADYYEDSVTLGLASFRPSRVPVVLNVRA